MGIHDSYPKSNLVGCQNVLCLAGDQPNEAIGNTKFLDQSLYCKRISRREENRGRIPNQTPGQPALQGIVFFEQFRDKTLERGAVHGQDSIFQSKTEKKKLTFSLDIPRTLSSSCGSPEQRSVRGAEGSQYHKPLDISLGLMHLVCSLHTQHPKGK